jgi:hypothetical protein
MELLTNNPWEGNGPGTANFIELGVIVTRGPELEVSSATLRACSETFVAFSSPSTFRAAESGVIIEGLRAAAGRTAGTGGPPHGSDSNVRRCKTRSAVWEFRGELLRAGAFHVSGLHSPLARSGSWFT